MASGPWNDLEGGLRSTSIQLFYSEDEVQQSIRVRSAELVLEGDEELEIVNVPMNFHRQLKATETDDRITEIISMVQSLPARLTQYEKFVEKVIV